MSWQITISGVAVGAELHYIQESLNGHEEAKFSIPNNPQMRDLVASDNDAVFSFGGVDIFQGYVTRPEYDQESITCTAYNEVYTRLDRKVFSANYTLGTNSQYVFQQIAATVPLVATGGCPASTVAIRYDYTSCFDAVKILAQSLNSDYWTTAGSTIHIGTRGSDKGTIPSIAVSRRTDDRGRKRNKVYVRGFDKSGNLLVGSAGDGANEVAFTERMVADQTTLDKVASYRLAQLNKDTQGVKVTLNIADGAEVYPGDSITLTEAPLKLSGSYRIWRTTKKPTTVDAEIDRPEALLEMFIEDTKNYGDIGVYTIGGSVASGIISYNKLSVGIASKPADYIVFQSGTKVYVADGKYGNVLAEGTEGTNTVSTIESVWGAGKNAYVMPGTYNFEQPLNYPGHSSRLIFGDGTVIKYSGNQYAIIISGYDRCGLEGRPTIWVTSSNPSGGIKIENSFSDELELGRVYNPNGPIAGQVGVKIK